MRGACRDCASPISMVLLVSLGGLALVGSSVLASDSSRLVLDLSENWEFLPTRDLSLDFPPPEEGWRITDTRMFPPRAEGAPGVWYRKRVRVPHGMVSGRQVRLEFGGAKFEATVYIDGRPIGTNRVGFVPFAFDIGDHVEGGREVEIVVAVRGALSTLRQTPGGDPTRADVLKLQDSGLVPLGLVWRQIGLWDGVRLVSYAPVHIEDVFVTTSVRRSEITVNASFRNEGESAKGAELQFEVYDGEQRVLTLPSMSVLVSPLEEGTVTTSAKWDTPRFWSPDDPHMYTLRTAVVVGGGEADRQETRFGFREFWTDGDVFRLNGIRTRLRCTAAHFFSPTKIGWATKQGTLGLLRIAKEHNFNAMRFHAQIWPNHAYEAADEAGLLVVAESPMWTQIARYAAIGDQRFWQNAREQLRGLVRRNRNNPSVVIWSVENEFLHMTSDPRRFERIEHEVAELGRFVKLLDPTRPITYHGDLDPEGTTDVLNLHYVVEYPAFNMLPEEFYWLDRPTTNVPQRGGRGPGAKAWRWTREKPLHLGEFAWLPADDPDVLSGITGEQTYWDWPGQREAAKAEIWKMAIPAHRSQGVSAMCPWTPFEGRGLPNRLFEVCRETMAPVTIQLREYDSAFYGGEKVVRTLFVYNDSLRSVEVVAWWGAKLDGGVEFAAASQTLRLEPTEMRTLPVELSLPRVEGTAALNFEFGLSEAGVEKRRESRTYLVYPKVLEPLELSRRVLLYDPIGRTRAVFDADRVPYAIIEDPQEISGAAQSILVVGMEAADWRISQAAQAISDFVSEGGVVVAFEQPSQQAGGPTWVPGGFKWGRGTTIAFRRAPRSPVLSGISDEDLRFWGSSGVVARTSILPATSGNYRPIIDSSDGHGLVNSLLTEVPFGRGAYVLSCLNLHDLAGVHPVADKLRRAILAHADRAVGAPRRLIALGPLSHASAKALNLVGVEPEVRDLAAEVERGSAMVVAGDEAYEKLASSVGAARDYVSGGGRLLLHDPPVAAAGIISELVGGELRVQPSEVEVAKVLHPPDGAWLAAGMSSRLLYRPIRREGRERSGIGALSAVLAVSGVRGAEQLTEPCGLLVVPLGEGEVVIDSVVWNGVNPSEQEKASRYLCILLTNLGVVLSPAAVEALSVDISTFANRGFRDDKAGDGAGGWTDHGEDDMRFFPDPSLRDWIPGMPRPEVRWRNSYGGIEFAILNPDEHAGRSCVVVGGPEGVLPDRVKGIRIGQRVSSLSLLLAAEVASPSATEIGQVVLNLTDGRKVTYPIVRGQHIADWREPPPPGLRPAWVGPNAVRERNFLYAHTVAAIPRFLVVDSIDLISSEKNHIVLLAVSVYK